MRQLVREETLSLCGLWSVLSGIERDVAAYGICNSVQGAGRSGSLGTRMDPDAAEILSKTGLQKCARTCVQRLAHTRNNGGRSCGRLRSAFRRSDISEMEYLSGGPIGLLLILVTWLAHQNVRRRTR
jgi:hypothetical protein